MIINVNLNVSELNDLYYAIGKLLQDGTKEVYRRNEMSQLQDKVWKKLVELNSKIDKQIEQDKIHHELNYKYKLAKHGDY